MLLLLVTLTIKASLRIFLFMAVADTAVWIALIQSAISRVDRHANRAFLSGVVIENIQS